MSDSSHEPVKVVTRGGTRFRRSALLFLPAMLGVLILTLCLLFGVLPLRLYLTGQDFKLGSNGGELIATGVTLHGGSVQKKFDGQDVNVALATISNAELKKGVCISLTLKFPVIGTWTVTIKTDGDTVVKNLTLGATALNGSKAVIGGSAQNPAVLGPSVPGGEGLFGLKAKSLVVKDVKASGDSAAIVGTADLAGIWIPRIHKGSKGSCF